MLRVVGALPVLPELHGPLGRLEGAHDELHHRGLAGAVGPHQGHVIAAVEFKVHVAVDDVAAVGGRHLVERHLHVARARRLGEAEGDLLGALRQHHELLLDPLDLLDAVLDLLGLRGLVAEAVHEDLHVLDVALLRGALLAQLLEVVLAKT